MCQQVDSNHRTRKGADLQSAAIAAMRYWQVRKEEDGSVDILFYDRHYLGEYLQTPITPASIHSRTIDVIIPRSTFVHPIGLEPMTSAM